VESEHGIRPVEIHFWEMAMMLNLRIALIALVLVSSDIYALENNDAVESPASSTGGANTTDSGNRISRCREQWQKYRESEACFAQYKIVNGGTKAEAFEHCPEVQQPGLCE
jgi:hypothetical protein